MLNCPLVFEDDRFRCRPERRVGHSTGLARGPTVRQVVWRSFEQAKWTEAEEWLSAQFYPFTRLQPHDVDGSILPAGWHHFYGRPRLFLDSSVHREPHEQGIQMSHSFIFSREIACLLLVRLFRRHNQIPRSSIYMS